VAITRVLRLPAAESVSDLIVFGLIWVLCAHGTPARISTHTRPSFFAEDADIFVAVSREHPGHHYRLPRVSAIVLCRDATRHTSSKVFSIEIF
jgi:hypothetical protein